MKYTMKPAVLALVALLSIACSGGASKKTAVASAPVEAVPVVAVARACSQDVRQDAIYSTTVQANIINNIVPQAGSRIRKVNVEVGDFVSKGQVLAEMDRSNLKQAELQLSNNKKELDRLSVLYKKGGVSQADYESAELAYEVARNSYENLLENTILRSPVDGVITSRGYDEGDMYSMAGPLFVVQQITPVKLLVSVSETDYAKVKKGDKVDIKADALPGQIFTGEISRVYPVVDASTHTVSVEVKVANKDRKLRPGMYVTATVLFAVNHSVVIPDTAIQKQQGSGVRTAYVLEQDGTVSLRMLTLGRRLGDSYEILSGISEGENVVVKGLSSLRDGIKVELAK